MNRLFFEWAAAGRGGGGLDIDSVVVLFDIGLIFSFGLISILANDRGGGGGKVTLVDDFAVSAAPPLPAPLPAPAPIAIELVDDAASMARCLRRDNAARAAAESFRGSTILNFQSCASSMDAYCTSCVVGDLSFSRGA